MLLDLLKVSAVLHRVVCTVDSPLIGTEAPALFEVIKY